MWSNLLITTDKGLFRVEDSNLTQLFSEKDCYGLTWDDKNLFVSTPKNLRKLSKSFSVLESWSCGVDLHQCLYHNNKVYICATKQCSVSVLDCETGEVESNNFDGSNRHLNSVFKKDDSLFVCLHGNCNKGCVITKLHSSIVELNQKFKVINKFDWIGCGNHNVYVDDKNIYTLSSAHSFISKIDLKTKEVDKFSVPEVDEKRLYPRGLAKSDDFFYVGAAQHADRNYRDRIKSYILAYDNDLNLVDTYEIPELHHIREVRLINQVDHAHNGIILEL